MGKLTLYLQTEGLVYSAKPLSAAVEGPNSGRDKPLRGAGNKKGERSTRSPFVFGLVRDGLIHDGAGHDDHADEQHEHS